MDRKWKSGALGVAPDAALNASDGYATPGNPGGGIPPTKPGAYWYHMITEELLSIIASVGVAFDKTIVTQVRDALIMLFDPQGIEPGGRLTLTSAVPVTTADVAGAVAVFYTPDRHNRIRLYDGIRWKWYTVAEMSQLLTDATKSPAAAVANTNYDHFVWDNAGVVRCTRGPTWNAGAVAGSDTARGTGANSSELEFFDGRWVNKNAITNGPAARSGLYIGTSRTDGAAQVNDTFAKRHVWNCYNRVMRAMRVLEPAASYTYTTATIRQVNANVANQLDFVRGLDRDAVEAEALHNVSNNAVAVELETLIGLDSTSVAAAGQINHITDNPVASRVFGMKAAWRGYPGLGRHTVTWLERSAPSGVSTWLPTNGLPGQWQAGIHGSVLA